MTNIKDFFLYRVCWDILDQSDANVRPENKVNFDVSKTYPV